MLTIAGGIVLAVLLLAVLWFVLSLASMFWLEWREDRYHAAASRAQQAASDRA